MAPFIQSSWESPIGRLRISVSEQGDGTPHCVGLYFPGHQPTPKFWSDDRTELDWRQHDFVRHIVDQLAAYFADGKFRIELPCHFSGTDFQQQVWHQLTLIPAGTTRTYREIATLIDRPAAVRAVGSAVARNPLSIIVPCHRVIASGGGLAGFAGGCDRKRFLLNHELLEQELLEQELPEYEAGVHTDTRNSQSTTVTTPVATIAQPNAVSVRVAGNRPVQVTRAAAIKTASARNAKQSPPALA
ncbi:methylated-DNA--[protein]-cysteine S-methyltransferase [Allorhodopirellula heiligendammensis]|uniref:methylated-DNA--[protein]-cysteine S-methyltransferase n=1 Tax=Allorhodopirellula heiligendammensis TaxID=2714739 RepID=A0A5C6BV65_9BACT|nr:methylated-DNA--[protein]-cysteine S-methyltransferase [Allorhodopirellula heiligendammensis]TWU15752.1 Methylated-DNA--protein-cysteine methyltransferase [Allorhodopirellula heiligendammensis]